MIWHQAQVKLYENIVEDYFSLSLDTRWQLSVPERHLVTGNGL